MPHLVTGWVIGVFGLSLWHLGGWAQLQRLRRKLIKPVDAALSTAMEQLAAKLGVNRAVELLESALVQVPTVVGWLRPVILLPASALTGLSTEQLEALLAHELAHVQRYDYLVNILQTVIETLGFYHPAVWWVSHKIRIERENCCDDVAVGICGDRVRYARALTSMEEIRSSQPELAVAASGGDLLTRVCRLLGNDTADRASAGWLPSVIAILLIAIVAVPTSIALNTNVRIKDQKASPASNKLVLKLLDPNTRPIAGAHVGTSVDWSDTANNPPIWFLRDGRNPRAVKVESDKYGKVTLEARDLFWSVPTTEQKAPITAIDKGHLLAGLRELSREDLGTEVTLTLQPGCKVHGRMSDATARKRQWSTDVLNVYVYWRVHMPYQCSSKQKQFELILPPGEYKLRIFSKNPNNSITLPVLIKPGQRDLDVTKYLDGTSNLPDTGTDGRVVLKLVDPNSQPVVGAWVGTFLDWSDMAENRPIWFLNDGTSYKKSKIKAAAKIISNREGRITLTEEELFKPYWPAEVTVPLIAIDNGHYLAGLQKLSRVDLGKEVTLTLRPGCRVRGRVSAAIAHKHDWSTKILTLYTYWNSQKLYQCTSMQGRFEFVLPSGQYEVQIYAEDPGKAVTLPISIKPGERDLDITEYLDDTRKLPPLETENLAESDSSGESPREQAADPNGPVAAKTAAPSGRDKPQVQTVRVELSVVEVPSDLKMDRETIIEVKNVLGDKITLADSPAVADLVRQASQATAAVKDESAGDKRVTQEQFDKLFDLLASRSYLKILLRPTLEVVEGQTAQIRTDRNSLEVLVRTVKDNAIDLQVQADLSTPVPADSNDQTPMFSTRSFSTRVYINSGQSLVIGGLIRPGPRSDAESNAEASQASGKELMCILSARITTPPGDAKLRTESDFSQAFKPRIIKLQNSDPAQMARLMTALFAEESVEGINIRNVILGEDAQRKPETAGPLSIHFMFVDTPGTNRIIVISNILEAYEAVEQLVLELDKQKMANKDVNQAREWIAGLVKEGRLRPPKTVNEPTQTQPAAVITGRVLYGATGKPAAGVVVYAMEAEPGSTQDEVLSPWRQTVTDERGRYRLESLRSGECGVWVEAENLTAVALDSFQVKAGETREAPDLVLIEGGFIAGRIIDESTGKPIKLEQYSGVIVSGPFRPKNGLREAFPVREDGSFRIRVAPGRNSVALRPMQHRSGAKEYASLRSVSVTVDEGETVEVELRVRKLSKEDMSAERLTRIGEAMRAYANDHDGNYPARTRLYELQEYLKPEEFAWPSQYEYLAEGKTTSDRPDIVIYYDAPLLEQGRGTNVLFNDGHVEFVGPKRLNEPNINKTQILLETRILYVTDDFLRENRLDANSVRTGKIRSAYPIAESAAEPNSLAYCLVLDDLDVNLLLKGMGRPQGKGNKMLAVPQARVLDGRPATIEIIRDFPVPGPNDPNDASDKTESKLQYVHVGTSIKITPDALPDSNNVLLDFEWEHSQVRDFVQRIGPDGKKQKVPVIDRYNMRTRATVPEGGTLLIGPKKIRRLVVTRTKKPLLGDLPLIGSLFRSESRLEETRNVLILIKPSFISAAAGR